MYHFNDEVNVSPCASIRNDIEFSFSLSVYNRFTSVSYEKMKYFSITFVSII